MPVSLLSRHLPTTQDDYLKLLVGWESRRRSRNNRKTSQSSAPVCPGCYAHGCCSAPGTVSEISEANNIPGGRENAARRVTSGLLRKPGAMRIPAKHKLTLRSYTDVLNSGPEIKIPRARLFCTSATEAPRTKIKTEKRANGHVRIGEDRSGL